MNIVAGALAGTGPGSGWRLGADEAAANHCVPVGADYTNGLIQGDISGTLEAAQSKLNRGQGVMVPFDTTQITSAANRSNPKPGDPCHPLAAGAHAPAIAFDARQSDVIEYGDKAGPLDTCGFTMGVQQARAVRRLMPVECERLQGFKDGHTAIMWRGKPAADGPRYKALGNSWAVNCARWIGRRIEAVESIKPHNAGIQARP